MNAFQKMLSRAAVSIVRVAHRIPVLRSALAYFESARTWFTDRSWIYQGLQDAWIEIDAQTRMELQRVHEYLLANAAIVQKIRRVSIQFSVGPSGLIVTPNAGSMDEDDSSDPAEKTAIENWNHARSENWARWWRNPELNSEISGSQLTRVWAGLLFDKGEIFVNLTEEKLPGLNKLVPRVETIDAHRCQTPTGQRENKGNPIIDGVEMDTNGKVVAYWFKKTNFDNYSGFGDAAQTGAPISPDCFTRIDAYNKKTGRRKVLHKFKTLRPGQVRGLPEGFSVYNLVRDNLDLHKMEMQAAKLASSIANVETNPSGELDTLFNRKSRISYGTQTAAGAQTTKTTFADYKVTLGSSNIAMRAGDDIKNFMINRPTVATQDYWDLHYTLICMGYNIPKLLVMPSSLQGTVTRADLDVAGYGFGRENFELIAELLRDVYEWQTEWAVNQDRSLDGKAPDDYLCCVIRPPRAPNVDVGYNAKALETELRLGIKTIQDVYAERQQDWRVQIVQICEAQKFIRDKAKEYGVEPGQISELATSASAMKPGQPQSASTEEDATQEEAIP